MPSSILPARSEQIGVLPVRRALPRRECRSVGPFVFVDHMGPIELPAGTGIDVPPHPHIGLSTLTYLYEGSMLHRDSLGTQIEILPGAVNWMTAGRGIAHSERSSPASRAKAERLHGIQIWVALRSEDEECDPQFASYEAAAIPEFKSDGFTARLIAGAFEGRRSPIPRDDMICIDLLLENRSFRLPLADQIAVYISSGDLTIGDQRASTGDLVLISESELTISGEGRCMIFGGDALPEQRFFYWNFVSSSKDRIVRAKKEWQEQSGPFAPRLPEETDWLPLPEV
ncbi:MAG: pirin family protein [Leptonema illini]|uniref:Pirin family protein n=1 Tax=Leptonema illini TaxID=183 RepID=A0A833GYW1_9LEPT|nr:MAG: pirin family protein [Leptonema illini]